MHTPWHRYIDGVHEERSRIESEGAIRTRDNDGIADDEACTSTNRADDVTSVYCAYMHKRCATMAINVQRPDRCRSAYIFDGKQERSKEISQGEDERRPESEVQPVKHASACRRVENTPHKGVECTREGRQGIVPLSMPTYCAFLGHQPHISLAELCVLLPDLRICKLWNQHIMTFESEQTLDREWFSRMGGTVLIAQERTSLPGPTSGRAGVPTPQARGKKREENNVEAVLERLVHPLLERELAGGKRKVTFSFRCFGVPRKTIRTLYRSSKRYLRAKGIPSRYIGNERHPAKPGTLLLRGIPGLGCCELVILRDEGQDARTVPERRRAGGAPAEGSGATGSVWVGATSLVQDIEAYTERDIGKPFRDTRTGLLPPKLAQIMLNLGLLVMKAGEIRKSKFSWENVTIWDPFCGSGVIALEALLRRAHILASDRSERALRGCEENIRWLRHREKTPKVVTHAVLKHDACKPFLPPGAPRAPSLIVTETSLGPALKAPPTKADVKALLRNAEQLEEKFFTNLTQFLPGVPVVAAFPVFVTRDGTRHFLPRILETLAMLGYRLTFPGNKAIRMTDRHTLLYLRPDQYVGREIVCLLAPNRPTRPLLHTAIPKPHRRKKHAR